MTLSEFDKVSVTPGLALLPATWDSLEARAFMFATALQESELAHRYQIVQGRPGAKGPARSFYQFELGTRESKGGVWGIFLHKASRAHLQTVCAARGVPFDPTSIWLAIEHDDVLASACARLLMRTDAQALPKLGDEDGAWKMYRYRLWRPGKPHPETWPANYRRALAYVTQ